MNPWHDISLGDDPVRVFRCIIEIPRGSKNKYELDKETGMLKLDYKRLENKVVDVEEMEGAAAAQRVIRDAVALYREKVGDR